MEWVYIELEYGKFFVKREGKRLFVGTLDGVIPFKAEIDMPPESIESLNIEKCRMEKLNWEVGTGSWPRFHRSVMRLFGLMD